MRRRTITLEEVLLGGKTELKGACCNFYEHDIIKILFGDSIHPGGLELTRELGNELGLDSDDKVLDIASGLGTSAIFLAEEFGSEVIGIDLSKKNVNEANQLARNKNLDNVSFMVGDAERLEYKNQEFDVVISECSFCTFPNKTLAAQEMNRILKQGGRLGLTDVAIEKELPIQAKSLLLSVACIGDALSMEGYRRIFSEAGFVIDKLANRRDIVLDTVSSIKKKLFIAEIAKGLKKIDLNQFDIKQAKYWLKEGKRLLMDGYGTYLVLVGRKLQVGENINE
jgi:ubiquinone/menaquinone biosynthesis C-methylase UbiE